MCELDFGVEQWNKNMKTSNLIDLSELQITTSYAPYIKKKNLSKSKPTKSSLNSSTDVVLTTSQQTSDVENATVMPSQQQKESCPQVKSVHPPIIPLMDLNIPFEIVAEIKAQISSQKRYKYVYKNRITPLMSVITLIQQLVESLGFIIGKCIPWFHRSSNIPYI